MRSSTTLLIPLLALGAIAEIQNQPASAHLQLARSSEPDSLAARAVASAPEVLTPALAALEKRQRRRGGRRVGGNLLNEEEQQQEQEEEQQEDLEEEREEAEEDQEEAQEEQQERQEEQQQVAQQSSARKAVAPWGLSTAGLLGIVLVIASLM